MIEHLESKHEKNSEGIDLKNTSKTSNIIDLEPSMDHELLDGKIKEGAFIKKVSNRLTIFECNLCS